MGETPSGETLLTQYGAADTGSVTDVLIDDRIVLEWLYGNRRTPLLSFGQLPTRLFARSRLLRAAAGCAASQSVAIEHDDLFEMGRDGFRRC
jgi:hypothetical protein